MELSEFERQIAFYRDRIGELVEEFDKASGLTMRFGHGNTYVTLEVTQTTWHELGEEGFGDGIPF